MKTSISWIIPVACVLALACDDKAQGSNSASGSAKGGSSAPAKTASASKSSSSSASSAATPAPSGSAAAGGSASAATSASAPAGEASGLASMFAGPPEAGTKDSETIFDTGGWVLGFPNGWKSGNVKDKPADSDTTPSNMGTAFTSPPVSATVHGAEIFCRPWGGTQPLEEVHKKVVMEDDNIKDVKWTEEVEGKVGVGPYPAKIGKGTAVQAGGAHEPVVAYYVFVSIPDTKWFLCGAAYPSSKPELEKDVVTAFKGLKQPAKK